MRWRWRGVAVVLAVGVGCGDSGGSEVDAGKVTDLGAVDSGEVDAGAVDTGAVDTGAVDTGAVDAGAVNTGTVDVGVDSGVVDVGVDGGGVDAGVDGGGVDAGVDVPVDLGPMCASPMIACDGACIDPMTDRAHCGSCGSSCCTGSVCVGGACVFDCSAGITFCGPVCAPGGGCFDLALDVHHCGGCDVECPAVTGATATCAAGACGFTCTTGRADCDGMAGNGCEVELASSTAHCGACGTACGAGQTCSAGACVDLPCPNAGEVRCGGVCTDRQTSTTNCGACGTVCPGGAHATATCAAGACRLACAATFASCDGSDANGCETDLTTTATSCGRCGNACESGFTCVTGHCERNTCLAPSLCTGGGCAACTRVAFDEDWESGTTRWNLPRGGSTPITTTSDGSDCHGSFLRETELFSAGRVLTSSGIPVTAGQRYCVSAWIRGSAGTWPFVGMRASSATASLGMEHWLIGQPCFSTSLSVGVAPVTSDGTWRWYAREFTMPAYTHIVLELEIWNGGAAGTADFDHVQVLEGPCPTTAPTVTCTAATCAP